MNIALIAHDGKKADLVSFVLQRMDFFKRKKLNLVATGTTGKMIMDAGVSHIQRVASGPIGGDAEIGAMVVIFKTSVNCFTGLFGFLFKHIIIAGRDKLQFRSYEVASPARML